MPISKFISILIFSFALAGLTGCAPADAKKIRSGASIIDKHSNWTITHPRDNASGEKLDFLKNENMTIWIKFTRNKENKHFYIVTDFIELLTPVEFSPSRIVMKLTDGRTLKGKAISCYSGKWDLESLRIYTSIEEPIRIEKAKKYYMSENPCYALFFDYAPPPVDEEFILLMNDALTSNGVKIGIPPILFRKTTDYNIRFGLGVE